MPFDASLLEERLPIWKALSELFLDDHLQESDFAAIARELSASGSTTTEVESILWSEVFPALGGNFQVPAGAWGGFTEAELLRRIPAVANGDEPGLRRYGPMSEETVREIVAWGWSRVLAHLPTSNPTRERDP